MKGRSVTHGWYSEMGKRGGLLCLVAFLLSSHALLAADDRPREQALKIVTQIQRADYEGDRAALKRLYGELTSIVNKKEIAAPVRYWRGFALWRRAMNGFNESVDRTELQQDLNQALEEFNESAREQPDSIEAKIGALSCVSLIGATLIQNNPARWQDADVQAWWAKARELTKEAQAIDPENPRLLWVMGPNIWHIPVERGGGQEKAIAMYEKGLEVIRKHESTASDPLVPSWGEPELLMNLAWSNLNRTTPDLKAAEQYAQSALRLVPHWHYVRDILVPQIREAKSKTEPKSSAVTRLRSAGRTGAYP